MHEQLGLSWEFHSLLISTSHELLSGQDKKGGSGPLGQYVGNLRLCPSHVGMHFLLRRILYVVLFNM